MEHLEPKQAQEFLQSNPDALFIDRRSEMEKEAGEELERHGFTRVCNVAHGFEGPLDARHQRNTNAGWRHAVLPWEQC